MVTETKDQNKQKDSEDSPADEKKEENSDAGTVTETATPNKKKAAARKRSVGKVSLGKSPRSSKYVILKYRISRSNSFIYNFFLTHVLFHYFTTSH